MTDWQHHTDPLLILVGLCLGIGLATYPENAYTYASTIAVNSTYPQSPHYFETGLKLDLLDKLACALSIGSEMISNRVAPYGFCRVLEMRYCS